MITAFQQGRNCLIMGKIFKVMISTELSNVGNQKTGVKKKEKIRDFSEQILSSNFLGRVRGIKTCAFSEQSEAAVRKAKIRPRLNLCVCSKEANPVQ